MIEKKSEQKNILDAKRLTIELVDRNAPIFVFEGEWAGRDIMVVARTIVRAYRKRQLATRHESSENKSVSPAIGATNGRK